MKRRYEPIVVLGPGRSGTSCVAGVLHRLGVYMGSRLLPADPTNPYGHWEDCDFVELDEDLLFGRIAHATWRARVSAVIEERMALGIPWGWKDPRVCELLPHYLEFFNDPTFVRCVRSPDDVEGSFMKAYGDRWKRFEAHALRVRREAALDHYLPWYRTLELDFERLRGNRAECVASLAAFCDVESVPAWRRRAAIESIRR